MNWITPRRIANLFVAAAVVAAIVLLVGHTTAKHDQRATTHPGTSASTAAKPNVLNPSLPPETPRYPELNARVTRFVQLRYSRPVHQTPEQLKNLLQASGLATPSFIQNLALVTPPAYTAYDAANISVVSQVIPGTLDGEFTDERHTQVVETYMVKTHQVIAGKEQYPAQFFESSSWKLQGGQWLVDTTTP